MTDPAYPRHGAPGQHSAYEPETPTTEAHTDPVVQRVVGVTTGLEQLVNGPLGDIVERLEQVHTELQTALASIDAPTQK